CPAPHLLSPARAVSPTLSPSVPQAPIPKELSPPPRGCEARATPGWMRRRVSTPKELAGAETREAPELARPAFQSPRLGLSSTGTPRSGPKAALPFLPLSRRDTAWEDLHCLY